MSCVILFVLERVPNLYLDSHANPREFDDFADAVDFVKDDLALQAASKVWVFDVETGDVEQVVDSAMLP